MDSTRAYWPIWVDSLRRQQLDGFALWLFESAGPLSVLIAQLFYISQPFASSQGSTHLHALAQLLEQEDEVRAFAALLKG